MTRHKSHPRAAPSPRSRATGRTLTASPGLRDRASRVLRGLRKAYQDAGCALVHRSAYELLVATILSAQCTDKRVNQVTPELFERYPDARALAQADEAELQERIRSTGFFRNKARNLIGMAQRVMQMHHGEPPSSMEELLELPGVARKTANCLLGTWFRKPEGVVVDTHVGRVAMRLLLAPAARDAKDAVRIEQALVGLFPRAAWTWLSHAMIEHGRRVCAARAPRCAECPLARDCPSARSTETASHGTKKTRARAAPRN